MSVKGAPGHRFLFFVIMKYIYVTIHEKSPNKTIKQLFRYISVEYDIPRFFYSGTGRDKQVLQS